MSTITLNMLVHFLFVLSVVSRGFSFSLMSLVSNWRIWFCNFTFSVLPNDMIQVFSLSLDIFFVTAVAHRPPSGCVTTYLPFLWYWWFSFSAFFTIKKTTTVQWHYVYLRMLFLRGNHFELTRLLVLRVTPVFLSVLPLMCWRELPVRAEGQAGASWSPTSRALSQCEVPLTSEVPDTFRGCSIDQIFY